MASFVLALTWIHQNFEGFAAEPWPWILRFAFPITAGFIGLMMVTRIRYVHLFNKLVTRKQSLRTMVLVLLIVMAVVIFEEWWRLYVPGLMLAYVLSGPIYFGYRFLRGRGLLGRRLTLAERIRQRDERTPKTD